jgi:hypothetical protein
MPQHFRLLTSGSNNHKIAKGNLKKYEAAVLHMAPHKLAGAKYPTVCPDSTPQCRATCLYWAGRGRMPLTQAARVRRTWMYWTDREGFMAKLAGELGALALRALWAGKRPVVRLDGTSDLGLAAYFWHLFPSITFYDYTKDFLRFAAWMHNEKEVAPNRYLTFSRSESNWRHCEYFLMQGATVTVVFWPKIPKTWQGYRVIDGDKHDFRFLDPPGVIVGLTAKGPRAKRIADPTGQGFVVQV